jgi:GNAT superfamily N-acetyltransferase
MTLIRDYADASDAEAVAVLAGQAWQRLIPVQDILEHGRSGSPGRIMTRRVAVAGDAVVAYGNAIHEPANPVGYFQLDVVVDGPVRRRGLGSRLLADVEQYACAHGATHLAATIPAEGEAGLAFAGRHGYAVERRVFQSFLDPAQADPALLTAPAPPGIQVTSLAGLGDTVEARRALWDVHERTVPDMPGARVTRRRPYEEFERAVLLRRWFRPAGAFLAADVDAPGAPWVGLAIVGYYAETNSLNHTFTGVLAAWRGRGVASALKRAAIGYAREIGAAYLRAGNDSANAPMLAINERYGYRRRPGHVHVGKTVG